MYEEVGTGGEGTLPTYLTLGVGREDNFADVTSPHAKVSYKHPAAEKCKEK